MYYYIYDSFLNDNKYQKILHRIENRIVDLGINGKIIRISMLVNPEKMVSAEIEKGAKTIIVVGNDKTVSKVISSIANKNVTLGIIPIGGNNEIAKILGIPEGSLACDMISQRRVKEIDLIKVNDKYCISNISMQMKNGKIVCDGEYEVKVLTNNGELHIYNLIDKDYIKKNFEITQNLDKFFDPNDGLLDVLIKPNKSKASWFSMFKKNKETGKTVSIIPLKNFRISEKDTPEAICDNGTMIKAPLNIQISPSALKVIISKNRKI